MQRRSVTKWWTRMAACNSFQHTGFHSDSRATAALPLSAAVVRQATFVQWIHLC